MERSLVRYGILGGPKLSLGTCTARGKGESPSLKQPILKLYKDFEIDLLASSVAIILLNPRAFRDYYSYSVLRFLCSVVSIMGQLMYF